MSSITWGPEVAGAYDKTYSAMFEPSVLDPMVGLLAEVARGGPALEFAVGTGRVALPLSAQGIAVRGLELSRHMAEQLFAKPGAGAVPVTIGDMTATRVPGMLDLMARITGFRLRERWAGWDRAPFTSDSRSQVAVLQKLP